MAVGQHAIHFPPPYPRLLKPFVISTILPQPSHCSYTPLGRASPLGEDHKYKKQPAFPCITIESASPFLGRTQPYWRALPLGFFLSLPSSPSLCENAAILACPHLRLSLAILFLLQFQIPARLPEWCAPPIPSLWPHPLPVFDVQVGDS